jgi:hypothetical protein
MTVHVRRVGQSRSALHLFPSKNRKKLFKPNVTHVIPMFEGGAALPITPHYRK